MIKTLPSCDQIRPDSTRFEALFNHFGDGIWKRESEMNSENDFDEFEHSTESISIHFDPFRTISVCQRHSHSPASELVELVRTCFIVHELCSSCPRAFVHLFLLKKFHFQSRSIMQRERQMCAQAVSRPLRRSPSKQKQLHKIWKISWTLPDFDDLAPTRYFSSLTSLILVKFRI